MSTNTRPLIAFDLDETLCCLRDKLSDAFAHIAPKPPDNWKHYDFKLEYGIGTAVAVEIMLESLVIEKCLPEPGASRLLHELKKNYDIEIWTARGWHPSGEQTTIKWLAEHLFPEVKVRLVSIHGSKAALALQAPNLVAFIDDLPSHVDAVKAAVPHVHCAVVTRPWNVGRQDLLRGDNALQALMAAMPDVLLNLPTPKAKKNHRPAS